MKTIQMTLDEELIEEVDQMCQKQGSNRSAFTRLALRAALKKYRDLELEARHRAGYRQKPVSDSEFNLEGSWPE